MMKSDQACAHKTVTIHSKELPLSCPTPEVALWNAHPKVYLPIDQTGKETCPYCGTKYVLSKSKR